MKLTFPFFAILLLLSFGAFAQTPDKINYQAVVRTSANELAANQEIGLQISILEGSTSGNSVYTEIQNPITNANGLMTLQIGDGTVVNGAFDSIDWSAGAYFIKTEVDPAGGTDYSITSISQLLSVPYALHAKTAETISGSIAETDPVYSESEAFNISATDITNIANLSGVNTGDQDISGIATNASAISYLQSEQETQNDAIALNTAKGGITSAQAAILENISGTNTGDQDISGIATNASAISSLETEQATQNAAIALNTAKIGITSAQAAILANTSGTNTGDQDISGIATNATAISSLESEQATQNSAIALNTAKTGITSAQAAILANTSGTNTGDQDISGIATNASAISSLESEQATQNSAIALNTAKTGITSAQAAIIATTSGTNTGDQDISGIGTNASAISSLESEQATQNSAIALNTAKTSNATHTGDVTGSTELTISDGAVTISKIGTEGAADARKVLTTDATGTPQWSAYSEGAIYGDVKNGIQAADHNGWVLMDGRAVSSLSASQQAKAADLGLSGNLPNAENTYLSQNGNALGSISGSNTVTVNQNNLPNVNLAGSTSYTPQGTVGSHSHKTTNTSLYALVGGGNSVDVDSPGGIGTATGFQQLGNTNTSSVAPPFTGTPSTISISNIRLNGNVTQQSLDIKPRTLSVNTFLYLGE